MNFNRQNVYQRTTLGQLDVLSTLTSGISSLANSYLGFRTQQAAANADIARSNAAAAAANAAAMQSVSPAPSTIAGLSLPVLLIGGVVVWKLMGRKKR